MKIVIGLLLVLSLSSCISGVHRIEPIDLKILSRACLLKYYGESITLEENETYSTEVFKSKVEEVLLIEFDILSSFPTSPNTVLFIEYDLPWCAVNTLNGNILIAHRLREEPYRAKEFVEVIEKMSVDDKLAYIEKLRSKIDDTSILKFVIKK